MSPNTVLHSPYRRGVLAVAIETTWLAALALVPLAFSGPDVVVFVLQPKDFVLHLAALLIVALWGFEWAVDVQHSWADLWSIPRVRRWLRRDPRNWALAAAGAFGLAATISTILSPLPVVSLWGRDFAQLGNELYSVLSLLVIFFAIAVRVRGPAQVRRILWAIVAAGALAALYGISQRYGWDPIGTGADRARVISSFGNPIFFGSYLVMSVVVTLGLALDPASSRRRWLLPTFAVLLGVQLAAMWFTGSRGPWIGLVFGLGAFALLGAITFDRPRAIRGVLVFAAGLVIAVVVTNLAGELGEGRSRGLGSIVSGLTPGAGGLSGRTDIWQGSVRLLDSWERQESESSVASALRPVFGLGPEMYHYSYPLTSNPQDGLSIPSHPHNLPLQLVLELGLAGLVTFVALAISVLVAGMAFLRRRGRSRDGPDDWLAIAMVAVIAGLVGRSVEQMSGIARTGDLVAFWALLGVALAIYGIGRSVRTGAPRSHKTGFSPLTLGVAATLAAAMFVIFVARDVQMLRSGLVAADAFDESAAGNRTEAIRLLEKAARISPDVQQYHVWSGELLFEEALAQTNAVAARQSFFDSYNAFKRYEKRDRLAYTTRLRIGTTLAELVSRGDDSRRGELVERSIRVADVLRAYPDVQVSTAQRVLIAGQVQLGLDLADRALAMEDATEPLPFAWFLRGDALRGLGDSDGALAAFDIALDRAPEGEIAPVVHRMIALVQDGLGNSALAAEHRARANEIEQSRAASGG